MPLVLPSAGSKQVASVHADIGANTSGFEKGAASVKSGLKDIGNDANLAEKKMAILGTVVSATTALIVDSYKEYGNLAESIRDLSLVSGESAENTSRFIQVLDDYQLAAEDATAAAKKLKDNGLSPTIETLAALSDQFRGIKDPAERMDFVYDKLGKSGGKFVNMLNQGSEALLANADAINKNLILSDFEIKMYEVGRLAIDEKTDAMQAFRVELGQNVGNVLAFASAMERANEIQQENTEVIGGQKRSTISYSDALHMAMAEQLKAADASAEYKYNLEEEKRAAEDAAKALKELSAVNKEIIDGAIDITKSQKDFEEQQADITQAIADTRVEGEKLYPWEAEKIQENKDKLAELGDQYVENQEKFRAAQEERAAMMAIEAIEMSDGIAGFSDAERERARVILETTDIATAAAFEEQQAIMAMSQAVADGTLPVENWGSVFDSVMADGVVSVEEVQAAIDAVPKENTVNFTITTTGAPPNLSMDTFAPGQEPARGTHRRSNAAGGTYMIPQMWGNEGFPLGNSDTASAGELITISPKGGNSTDREIIELLRMLVAKPVVTEYTLSQAMRDVVVQVSK